MRSNILTENHVSLADDRDEKAAVQSIFFDSTNIFNSPQKPSSDAANPARFTLEDVERKVEEEVQRRVQEIIKAHLAQQGNSTLPAHCDHGIEPDGRGGGQVLGKEKHSAVPPVMGTSNPLCESPQHDGKDYVPGRSRSTAPQQNLEQSQREEGSQPSFVHTHAESTRHLHSRECESHEVPPAPQAQQRSTKRNALSKDGCNKERRRLNKSIQVAIQNGRQNGDKLRFFVCPGDGILTMEFVETPRYKIR